ncbi:Uncharacterized protein Fot_37260 [Forsythia ovata]|uniref:Uncharacterized protein n=1 Tax=Forsythia ovata TaxID=205694 RepID=A0ABD1SRS9_9LAMI
MDMEREEEWERHQSSTPLLLFSNNMEVKELISTFASPTIPQIYTSNVFIETSNDFGNWVHCEESYENSSPMDLDRMTRVMILGWKKKALRCCFRVQIINNNGFLIEFSKLDDFTFVFLLLRFFEIDTLNISNETNNGFRLENESFWMLLVVRIIDNNRFLIDDFS